MRRACVNISSVVNDDTIDVFGNLFSQEPISKTAKVTVGQRQILNAIKESDAKPSAEEKQRAKDEAVLSFFNQHRFKAADFPVPGDGTFVRSDGKSSKSHVLDLADEKFRIPIPFRELWINSQHSEINGLINAKAMELVTGKVPYGKKVFPLFFVYVWKTNGKGEIERPKSRAVVMGNKCIPGADFSPDHTFTPVLRDETMNVLLADAIQKKRQLIHLDFKQAYLSSLVNDNLYPGGIKGSLANIQLIKI